MKNLPPLILSLLFGMLASLPSFAFPSLPPHSPTTWLRQGLQLGSRRVFFGHPPHNLPTTIRTRLFQSPSNPEEISRRTTLTRILKGGGLLVTAVPILTEFYARVGAWTTTRPFPLPQDWNRNSKADSVQHLNLVFHGASGVDDNVLALQKRLQQQPSSATILIDWTEYSQNLLQASFHGQRIGRDISKSLQHELSDKYPSIQTIHVIGISVGAFAADATVSSLKKIQTNNIFVQLTLLDPFALRGALDFGYGQRHFGESADYAQHYVNTDDPVPCTNAPLPKTVCFDITALRPPDLFGHDWPLVYYTQHFTGMIPPEQQLPRGTLIQVDKQQT